MLLKTVKVNNERNVVLQIPIVISDIHWQLKQGDSLEVCYDEDTKEVRIRPQKVSDRSNVNDAREVVFAEPKGRFVL